VWEAARQAVESSLQLSSDCRNPFEHAARDLSIHGSARCQWPASSVSVAFLTVRPS